jgi:hypothetical protein
MSDEMRDPLIQVATSAKQKEQILSEAKEEAKGMIKVANFRGNTQDPYPSPFLNLSDTKIPETSQEIFRWCKYFYMFDPLVAGAINALAVFPITEVYLEDVKDKKGRDDSDTLKTYNRVIHKTLNIHKLLIEIGIDYYLYGNCFVFGEMYTNPATGQKEWKHMVRLDPSKITIDYNPATQEKIYKWEIPYGIARIVRTKKPKAEYDKIPEMIKKAVIDKKSVILNPNNVYHFSRATDSLGDNQVWGTPVVANVLKLLMYRNTLRQAQEAIAREHIVPMRIYYLQKTDDFNPEADWNKVANDFAQELMKSVRDPNYKVVSPVPVNMLSVGGQGRALLLTPEIQQVQEEILAGMNVPREFIFGGISYSGSSISLKILENNFITYRVLLKDFIQNFVIRRMAQARKEWVNENDDDQLVTAKMTDLKMQDDVQQKQLIIQLNGAGKCSDEFMWKTIGIDPEKMREEIEREALTAVELESKVLMKKMECQMNEMELQLKLQQKQVEMNAALQNQAQQLMPQSGEPVDEQVEGVMPQQQNVDQQEQPVQEQVNQQPRPEQEQVNQQPVQEQEAMIQQQSQAEDFINNMPPEIKKIAMQIAKLPRAYRDKPIASFPANVQNQIRKAIQLLEQSEDAKKKAQIDMRPMPEKLPPRRDSLK